MSDGNKTKKQTLMTEGSIVKSLLLFALPLMVGNVFQQLYNTVDSIVVGNYVGKEALAAVGSTDSIVNTFIGFFTGLSTGAGVVISQYYGAEDDEGVARSVQTTIALTFIMSIFCTFGAILLVPKLLVLMGTPGDVFDSAQSYLRIYFAGVTGLLFYNMGSGILRAVGDSKRPLYFLIFSTILNILLDILFVVGLNMGVEGAGYATIIAQGVSALLILLVLTMEKRNYRIQWRRVRLHKNILRQIITVGLPAALQMMITSFSNVFVQSYINKFGSAAMAGWSSYGKIDKVCMLPIQSVGLSVTTFVGQNLGAGKADRAKKGTGVGIRICLVTAVVLIIPTWIFAPQLVGLFNGDEEVLYYGALFMRLLMPFYIAICANQVYAGSLRGAGNSTAPMIIMMSCFILFRQIYLFAMSRITDSVIPIALGYPMGWVLCSIIMTIYYRTIDLGKYKLTEK
ncbi:MAG: MATE family efflux transporter [Lachnospiraceae bacterium]|nr:MATE family efflux transporter [Lachnospiraceae bacterium]